MTDSLNQTPDALDGFNANVDPDWNTGRTPVNAETLSARTLPIHETHDEAVLSSLQALAKMGLRF